MGNTPTTGNNVQPIEDPTSSPIKLDVNLNKEVDPNLKQLTNWSLQQIRDIYTAFRRRRNSPLLNRTEFARLIGLSRTTAFYIYPFLLQKGNNDSLTVFEVIGLLVLTSYSRMDNKIYCNIIHYAVLFRAFDLANRGSLVLSDMLLLYKSVLKGFCRLTGQRCPEPHLLDRYSKMIFTKSDLNEQQGMEVEQQFVLLRRVIELFENNLFAVELFDRFKAEVRIKEEYSVFNRFVGYSAEEAFQIKAIALKPAASHFLEPLGTKNTSNSVSQDFKQSLLKTISSRRGEPKQEAPDSIPPRSALKKIYSTSSTKLNELRSRDLNLVVPSPRLAKSLHRKPLKVMIIKGMSITKKEIFKLKQYFESLSNGHSSISMSEFLEAFSGDKYDHMRSITASLFNFLDRSQTGSVTFNDLVRKLYPELDEPKFKVIQQWVHQYESMYNSDKKRNTQKKDQPKKRTLPKSCIIRLKQIFELFDRERKGWVSLDNLMKAFGSVYTERQILEMFEARDTNKDGKLCLEQFIRILLPADIEIEGIKST